MLPNRNWCYFEQNGGSKPLIYKKTKKGLFHHLYPSHEKNPPAVELGPTSTQDGHGSSQPPIHQHSHHHACTEKKETNEELVGTESLKIRLWLESGKKYEEGRRFVSYELLIPNLV